MYVCTYLAFHRFLSWMSVSWSTGDRTVHRLIRKFNWDIFINPCCIRSPTIKGFDMLPLISIGIFFHTCIWSSINVRPKFERWRHLSFSFIRLRVALEHNGTQRKEKRKMLAHRWTWIVLRCDVCRNRFYVKFEIEILDIFPTINTACKVPRCLYDYMLLSVQIRLDHMELRQRFTSTTMIQWPKKEIWEAKIKTEPRVQVK